ncbi:hypothetical protein ACFSQZ_13050 [Rubritalea spongiae]|uniref:Uncharacterized protein n=1 Tax=Rubritalea spongiae TaxID=430797 RepID=A0ABW5E438_9BACT
MRTKPVAISAADSVKKVDEEWEEDVPIEYLAEHSRGLPWHMLIPAGLVGVILFSVLVSLLFQTKEQPVSGGTSLVEASAPVVEEEVLSEMSDEERQARVKTYLNELVQSSSIAELESIVRPVPDLREKLENYYESHELNFKEVESVNQLLPVTSMEGVYLCSSVSEDGWHGLSVIFQRGNQFLLDWESFVAYCDVDWDKIKEVFPKEPITVRAVRSRSEYYNHGFDSETYQSFELMRNDSDTRFYAYVRRGSVAYSRLLPVGVSEIGIEMTLRVRYPEDAVGKNQLLIEEVVSDSWVVDYKKESYEN